MLANLYTTGRLDRPVHYRIGDSVGIVVPIGRNQYDRTDLDNYETGFLEVLAGIIQQTGDAWTLIDVGADIGLFSLKLLARASSISHIIAFEPNAEGFRWLKLNLEHLTIPAEAIMAAASDFTGTGRLAAPEARWIAGIPSNHTQYFLEAFPGGPVSITTIDALPQLLPSNLVIKLDVEGGEMAALRGAARTISAAPHVIVAVEAHPAVAARTGIDPAQCLRLLRSFRPFHFVVGETGMPVDPDMPLFGQIAPTGVFNVVATSV